MLKIFKEKLAKFRSEIQMSRYEKAVKEGEEVLSIVADLMDAGVQVSMCETITNHIEQQVTLVKSMLQTIAPTQTTQVQNQETKKIRKYPQNINRCHKIKKQEQEMQVQIKMQPEQEIMTQKWKKPKSNLQIGKWSKKINQKSTLSKIMGEKQKDSTENILSQLAISQKHNDYELQQPKHYYSKHNPQNQNEHHNDHHHQEHHNDHHQQQHNDHHQEDQKSDSPPPPPQCQPTQLPESQQQTLQLQTILPLNLPTFFNGKQPHRLIICYYQKCHLILQFLAHSLTKKVNVVQLQDISYWVPTEKNANHQQDGVVKVIVAPFRTGLGEFVRKALGDCQGNLVVLYAETDRQVMTEKLSALSSQTNIHF